MHISIRSQKARVSRFVAGTIRFMALICICLPAGAATIKYNVTLLPTLGGEETIALDINSLGEVAIQARPPAPDNLPQGTLYTGAPELEELGVLPGGSSGFPRGMNDSTEVVGFANTANLQSVAVIWRNDSIARLVELPDQTLSGARDINNQSVAVGWARIEPDPSSDFTKAVMWQDDTITPLITPANTINAQAFAINDHGHVVGRYDLPSTGLSGLGAFWKDGQFFDLGTLGGTVARAMDINNSDQIVGESTIASGNTRAFLWEDDVMIDLGSFGNNSFAFGINNRGHVVGTSDPSSASDMQAFFWKDGQMENLNDLIDPSLDWELISATGINDAGEIIATGRVMGDTRSFLLTVIPEPGGFSLGWIAFTAVVLRFRYRPSR